MAAGGAGTEGWFSNPQLVESWEKRREARQQSLVQVDAALFEGAGIRAGMRVLDLGAGSGDLALELSRRVGPGGHVLAVDSSEPMVDAIRRSVLSGGIHNIQALVMDADRLDLPPASLDAVVARMVLMFVGDLPGALERVRGVLRDGGRFAASVWSTMERNPSFGTVFQVAEALGVELSDVAARVPSLADPDLLRQTVAAAGFSDVKVRKVPVWRDSPDLEAALQETSSGGMFQAIPAELRPQAVELLADLWKPYVSDRFRMPGEQLVVAAST